MTNHVHCATRTRASRPVVCMPCVREASRDWWQMPRAPSYFLGPPGRMNSRGQDQPSVAVNVAIGQAVAQSLEAGNSSVSQQKPRSVTITPLTTTTASSLAQHPHTTNSMILLPAISTALQAFVKAHPSHSVPIQPKQQVLSASRSTKPPSEFECQGY